MDEKSQLRAFVLFLFLVCVLSLSGAATAAMTVTPSIPDYRPASTGGYFGSSGKWVPYVPASKSYTAAGVVNVGGKAISIPASIPVAATAGAALKTAMRLSPYAMLGSAALDWLAQNGIEPDPQTGEWTKFQEAPPYTVALPGASPSCASLGHSGTVYVPTSNYSSYTIHMRVGSYAHGCGTDLSTQGWTHRSYCYDAAEPCQWQTWWSKASQQLPVAPSAPATPEDFDALPDPTETPGVAEDAQGAPYVHAGAGGAPAGVPVGKPNYTSGNYPMGEPYKAPDGTTVQPMASVTNISNSNTVNISTYNITTHNADGTPTNNPTPTPTDEKQDECEAHPERVGCATLGEVAPETLPTVTHTMQFTPEASPITGACPAPIAMPGGHMLSFQSACDAMVQIKPVVLALAGVLVGFMVIGSIKNG